MATIADVRPSIRADDGFFLTSAIVMALVIVAGFSVHLAFGRSSFDAPPVVHAHALVFLGWVAIYVAQAYLGTRPTIALHRRLGWIAAGWAIAMVVLGTYVTVEMARRGTTPFFFQPGYFIVMNPLSVLAFAGFTVAAILLRRRTAWHRRLHFCGMAVLLGPAIGRLIPMPLLMPYAGEAVFAVLILFPIAGIFADLRRSGRAHPAWAWGLGGIALMQVAINAIAFGPLGAGLYDVVTRGSPGAQVAPLAFPPPPAGAPRP